MLGTASGRASARAVEGVYSRGARRQHIGALASLQTIPNAICCAGPLRLAEARSRTRLRAPWQLTNSGLTWPSPGQSDQSAEPVVVVSRGSGSSLPRNSRLDTVRAGMYVLAMCAAFAALPPLILASASPRRTELLRQLNVDFKVVPSDVPEIHHEELTARELSQVNAYRKARRVAKKYPDALVLGADTLVYLDSALFGKPATLEEAYIMLERLQGRAHHVVTAICLLHLRNHRQRVFSESTTVTFQPLDAVKIRRYLNRINPLDKAGAYAIQEEGDMIVEKVAGSYTNVVGLPLERLRAELQTWV